MESSPTFDRSVIIGIVRGFVKEAISIAALLFAIWAALYFGPGIGEISDSWITSEELQMWFGRILVFAVILSLGGLLGWGISKLVRLSVLSGMDRLAGSIFGAARGVLLVALFIIGGEFAGFGKRRIGREVRDQASGFGERLRKGNAQLVDGAGFGLRRQVGRRE